MTKRGRPKNLSKSQNRVFSLVMTEEASIVMRRIKNITIGNTKFVHKRLSDYIVKSWGDFDKILIEKQKLKNVELLDIENKLEKKKKELLEIIDARRKLNESR